MHMRMHSCGLGASRQQRHDGLKIFPHASRFLCVLSQSCDLRMCAYRMMADLYCNRSWSCRWTWTGRATVAHIEPGRHSLRTQTATSLTLLQSIALGMSSVRYITPTYDAAWQASQTMKSGRPSTVGIRRDTRLRWHAQRLLSPKSEREKTQRGEIHAYTLTRNPRNKPCTDVGAS